MATSIISLLGAVAAPIVGLFTASRDYQHQQDLLAQQAANQAAAAKAQQRLVLLIMICIVAVVLVWAIAKTPTK